MLSRLTGGQYVDASSGLITGGPYITADTPVPAVAKGALRFNFGRFEVWDGNYWALVQGGDGSVNLSPEAVEAINWVREKIEMDRQVERLTKESPAVADAVVTVKESLERLQVVMALANKVTI